MEKSEIEGVGYLVVSCTTGTGAFPIAGAVVHIASQIGNPPVNITVETDRSGKTEVLSLPTKSGAGSLKPQSSPPYLSYHVKVYASGYYPYEENNVPIFAGVIALQNASLIPLALYNSDTVYPRGIDAVPPISQQD